MSAAETAVRPSSAPRRKPSVLIVGAGFGGIAAAIELQAPRLRGRHDPRARARARRHVVLQQLPRRGLRRAEPPVLVLLRPATRLVAAVLAAGRDPRLPARASRATTTSSATSLPDTDGHALRMGRAARAVDSRRRQTGARYEADALVLATGQLHQPAHPLDRGDRRFAGHSFHSARVGPRLRPARASASPSSARARAPCSSSPRSPSRSRA